MKLLCLLLGLFYQCLLCRSGGCPEPFKKSHGTCLYAGSEELAWYEASQSCTSLDSEAELMSVDSLKHAEKLMKFVEEETGSAVAQIGALYFRDNFFWLNGDVGLPNDDDFQIDGPMIGGSCVAMRETAPGEMQLEGTDCLTVRLPYLCGIPGKEPPPHQGGFDCPAPFQKSKGMCLWVSDDQQGWYSAAMSCRALGEGSELLTVDSLKQAKKIMDFVQDQTGSQVAQVGALYALNDYLWIDGDHGIPNGDDFGESGPDMISGCVAMRETSEGEILLEKGDCVTVALPYLCGI